MSEDRERIRKMLEATSILATETKRLYDEEFPPVTEPPTNGNIVRVAVGENVQAAYDSIKSTGGTLLLAVGEHRCNLVINAATNDRAVHITSDTANLPSEGVRITRDYLNGIARLKSANNLDATINYRPGAARVNLSGIGFLPMQYDRTVLVMGTDTMTRPDQQPHDIVHNQILMVGDPKRGQHRGIQAHALNYTLSNSSILDFHEVGRDSQAVAAWNGGQNLLIRNCHLEAGAENVLFGGGAALHEDMAPKQITIEDCLIDKNPEWVSGMEYQPIIKCLLEIKQARQITIQRNVFQHCWAQAWPTGVGIVFKCADQSKNEPWTLTEDVIFRDNIISKVGMGFSIVAKDDTGWETQLMRNVSIHNNLLHSIDVNQWSGKGAFMQLSDVPDFLTISHNTIFQNGWGIIEAWFSQSMKGLSLHFVNNAVWQGNYGIKFPSGMNYTQWTQDLGYSPTVTGNAIRRDADRSPDFGPGNIRFNESDFDISFNSDYSVKSGSAVSNIPTTDGMVVGCDVEQLP